MLFSRSMMLIVSIMSLVLCGNVSMMKFSLITNVFAVPLYEMEREVHKPKSVIRTYGFWM